MTVRLPDFIIAGVARCGTTSLYYYLKQHPEIGFPSLKEPKYFSSKHLFLPHNGPGDRTVDEKVVLRREEYAGLFSNLTDRKRIGEASSDYVYYAEVTAPSIREELGDISIIVIIRNPVDRAFSAYLNMLRDNRETLSFSEALNAEDDRLSNNWDWMWAYRNGGLYSRKIRILQKHFTRVKIVLYDDLSRDAHGTLRDIFRFLGVDDTFTANTSTRYSRSGVPSNSAFRRFLDRSNKKSMFLRDLFLRYVPRHMLERVSITLLKRPALNRVDASYLRDYFRPEIMQLEDILKRDLSAWK